jgi:hypothetical protein
MSATEFINRPEIRILLDELLPRKIGHLCVYECKQPCAIVVPPKANVHGSTMGTAYDYAFRFEMERIAPGVITQPWIAKRVATIMRSKARRHEKFCTDHFFLQSWRDPAAQLPEEVYWHLDCRRKALEESAKKYEKTRVRRVVEAI